MRILTVSFTVVTKLNKAVASWLSSLGVFNDVDVLDFTNNSIECFSECFISGLIVETTDEHSAILVGAHGVFVEMRPP